MRNRASAVMARARAAWASLLHFQLHGLVAFAGSERISLILPACTSTGIFRFATTHKSSCAPSGDRSSSAAAVEWTRPPPSGADASPPFRCAYCLRTLPSASSRCASPAASHLRSSPSSLRPTAGVRRRLRLLARGTRRRVSARDAPRNRSTCTIAQKENETKTSDALLLAAEMGLRVRCVILRHARSDLRCKTYASHRCVRTRSVTCGATLAERGR